MLHTTRQFNTTRAGKVAAGLILFMSTTSSTAHEAPTGWAYDLSCCSNKDCFVSPVNDVRETPIGYKVTATGEIIAYKDSRIKRSRDGEFHRCSQNGAIDHGRTLCLYVPERGM